MKEENKYWIITDYPQIKTSELVEEARKLFGKDKVYVYREYEIDTIAPAPKEIEYSKFMANIEPDQEHRDKSYNEYMKENKTFMNIRQYLILFLQVYKTTGEYLDIKGWTRTSSRWSDGDLVCGAGLSGNSGLLLGSGDVGGSDAGDGPRELFSLFPSLPLTLETIEIGGIKYDKNEVEQKLKDIKPLT